MPEIVYFCSFYFKSTKFSFFLKWWTLKLKNTASRTSCDFGTEEIYMIFIMEDFGKFLGDLWYLSPNLLILNGS